MKRHENREISCNVLLSLIENETDIDKRNIYIRDFYTKNNLSSLSDEIKEYNTFQFLRIMVDPTYKSIVEDGIPKFLHGVDANSNNVVVNNTENESEEFKKESSPERPEIDIAIVTIKRPELVAAKIALGIDPTKKADHEYHGYRFWLSTISREEDQKDDLNVVITMVGKDRNVPCANACRTLFQQYSIKTCILLGMAAGPESKVNLGDVVIAEQVYDYEGARLEVGKHRKRPILFTIDPVISRHIEYFEPDMHGWPVVYYDNLKKLNEHRDIPDNASERKPEIMKKVILSGEKLVVDDSIEQFRDNLHEESRALEMEASGFASTCVECGKKWLVFRGISDFGTPATKDKETTLGQPRKVWQSTATLAAASALFIFLRFSYSYPKDDFF